MQNVQFERDVESVEIEIAVNEQFNNVLIDSITMFVGTFNDDGEYEDGDLAVNYSIEGKGVKAKTVVNSFYEGVFNTRLREILVAHGFSADAADNVNTSEGGMQEKGRASYDARSIADEVRKHFDVA